MAVWVVNNLKLAGWLRDSGHTVLALAPGFAFKDNPFEEAKAEVIRQHPEETDPDSRTAYRLLTRPKIEPGQQTRRAVRQAQAPDPAIARTQALASDLGVVLSELRESIERLHSNLRESVGSLVRRDTPGEPVIDASRIPRVIKVGFGILVLLLLSAIAARSQTVIVKDEGVTRVRRAGGQVGIDFVGAGVSCAANVAGITTCTIAGGGGGSWSDLTDPTAVIVLNSDAVAELFQARFTANYGATDVLVDIEQLTGNPLAGSVLLGLTFADPDITPFSVTDGTDTLTVSSVLDITSTKNITLRPSGAGNTVFVDNAAGDSTFQVDSAGANDAFVEVARAGAVKGRLFADGGTGLVGFSVSNSSTGFQIGFITDIQEFVKIFRPAAGAVTFASGRNSSSGAGNNLIVAGGETSVSPFVAGDLLLRGGNATSTATPGDIKFQKSDGSVDYVTILDSTGEVTVRNKLSFGVSSDVSVERTSDPNTVLGLAITAGSVFGTPVVAADPNTATWGTGQDGRFWFESTANVLRFWDGTAVQTLAAGGGSQHQIDGVNLTSNDPINFLDTAEFDWTNPAAGNLSLALKAGFINALGDFAAALCGTSEILEDQGASWACIATPSGAAHAVLSATHTDTTPAAVTRGGLMVGQTATPVWQLLTIGGANNIFGSDGTDAAWEAATGTSSPVRANNPLFPDRVRFTAIAAPAHSAGQFFYDSGEEALGFHNNEADITLQIGQEMWVRVRNESGSTITNGQVVYIDGLASGLPRVALARADAAATAEAVGLATHDIETASNGFVTAFGLVRDFDTSAFVLADRVYLSASTAGALTNTAPSDPNFVVPIGIVTEVNVSTGDVFVTLGAPRAIGGAGILVSGNSISTLSSEENFLVSGALTCGASTAGKMQTHTTPLQYCDNDAPPVLQFAAYGASDGDALAGDTADSFFDVGTVEVARGGTNLSSGTDGGILGFTATGTLASSALLDANEIVLGGGTGATPSTPVGLGTTTTLLHGNAAGAPTFGSVVDADIAANTITAASVAASLDTHTCNFVLFRDTGLKDSDDIESISNCSRPGRAITITVFRCETDVGSPIVRPQRDDGTPANLLTGDLTCTTGGADGTIAAAEDNFASTDALDLIAVSGMTGANRISLLVQYTVD